MSLYMEFYQGLFWLSAPYLVILYDLSILNDQYYNVNLANRYLKQDFSAEKKWCLKTYLINVDHLVHYSIILFIKLRHKSRVTTTAFTMGLYCLHACVDSCVGRKSEYSEKNTLEAHRKD